MARLKKVTTKDMMRIVDSFYESHGDPHKLRCSLLEEYALSVGIEIKAYDFRRDELVRQRIKELQSVDSAEISALAYKNLDADAFISRNTTYSALKAALNELDSYWRGIYERAARLAVDNTNLISVNFEQKRKISDLSAEQDKLSGEVKEHIKSENDLRIENRCLKKYLEKHLYPAVADEILFRECALIKSGNAVSPIVLNDLSEISAPLSLSEAIEPDILSREESIMECMKLQIHGGVINDATKT